MPKKLLFYLGVALIVASIVSGLVMYYYPETVEEPMIDEYRCTPGEGFIITPPRRTNQTEVTILLYVPSRLKTTYPLRDYQLLTYVFSSLGLGLIVTHHFRQSKKDMVSLKTC